MFEVLWHSDSFSLFLILVCWNSDIFPSQAELSKDTSSCDVTAGMLEFRCWRFQVKKEHLKLQTSTFFCVAAFLLAHKEKGLTSDRTEGNRNRKWTDWWTMEPLNCKKTRTKTNCYQGLESFSVQQSLRGNSLSSTLQTALTFSVWVELEMLFAQWGGYQW